MRFQKSQPAGAATLVPPLCLEGPTEKNGCIIPRTKSARPRNARKSWQHFEHLYCSRSVGIKEVRFF